MAIKRKDFQKVSSTVQEFLLKLPDEEASARLRDNLLQALHFLQLYYRDLQKRDRDTDPLQWNIDHSLSPLTPFKEAPDKFEWQWINVDSAKVRQSLPRNTLETFKSLPSIIIAIRDGDIALVKHLVKEDLSYLNQCDSFNRDCLTYAVEFEEFEILRYLLKHGANVNCIATDGSTCLHRAVYKDNTRMVKLLLEYGAYVNAQDSYNRSPIHWSVINKKTDCLKTLIEYDGNKRLRDRDGMSAAMWACHLDHLEHFNILVKIDDEKETEIEFDNDGRSWVHWCVRKKEPLDCLNAILNPETAMLKDKDGKTCLHVAAEQGAIDACKLIIEIAGRDTAHQVDNKKQTPLHLAALYGHARIIKLLIENGGEPYQKDSEGASVIDYVSKRKLYFCTSIIEMCLKQNEKKANRQVESSFSSVNGDVNITPAPPATPKNGNNRSFVQTTPTAPAVTPSAPAGTPVPIKIPTGKETRPPKPGFRYSKRKPRSSTMEATTSSYDTTDLEGSMQEKKSSDKFNSASYPAPATTATTTTTTTNNTNNNTNNYPVRPVVPSKPIPIPIPPSVDKNPTYDRMQSMHSSLKASRVSSRSSFVSEDLDKYMSNPNNAKQTPTPIPMPIPQPRLTPPSRQIMPTRAFSGRSSLDQSFDYSEPAPPPPVIKPRKQSSKASNSMLFSQENDEYNMQKQKEANAEAQSNYLNVEDISGDEEKSVTSTKGEGYGSDFSDTEVRNVGSGKANNTSLQAYVKRPTTPMEIRADHSNVPQATSKSKIADYQNNKGIKYQHIGEQQVSYRFNEWDPYNTKSVETNKQYNNSERQKSSLKPSKLSASVDHTRQTSGRALMHSATSSVQNLTNESPYGGLDLVVSGQKLGIKDNISPTSTPRESSSLRPPTRRLQPIDRNMEIIPSSIENEMKQPIKQNDMPKIKPKKSNTLDRKKLEPIKHILTHQSSLSQTNEIENDVPQITAQQSFDEDLSVSENTVSSDKQQIQSQFINTIKMNRAAKASAQQTRHTFTAKKTKLIEQLFNNNDSESLKS